MQGIVLGVLVGAMLSVSDFLLLKYSAFQANKEPDKAGFWLTAGMGMRYALTVLVLGGALFMPQMNAVAIILMLLLQKILLTICALRK